MKTPASYGPFKEESMGVKEFIKQVMEEGDPKLEKEELKRREEDLYELLKPLDEENESTVPSDENLDKWINKTIEKMPGDFSEEQKEEHKKLLEKVFKEGVPVKKAMGVSDKVIDWMYAEAYKLYQSGNYNEANAMFRTLEFLCPPAAKFSFGSAACLQMKKQYNKAIEAYMRAAAKDPESPIPFYHMADCFIKEEEYGSAMYALIALLDRSEGEELYGSIREKSKMMLADIEKKVGEKK